MFYEFSLLFLLRCEIVKMFSTDSYKIKTDFCFKFIREQWSDWLLKCEQSAATILNWFVLISVLQILHMLIGNIYEHVKIKEYIMKLIDFSDEGVFPLLEFF